ncbi:Cyclin-dependent protein kinase inhibitor SMR10 [Cardamine amara subsp. amara]|uniref:Cyclin-dependent protein kinase inhibitor SMR10 n=1 Tax=Cardamine amara subsp. amara TaxID=228776 RepID=A0ABD1AWT0_CARAN
MGFSDAGIVHSDQNNLSETELGLLLEPSLGFSDRSVHTSPQHEFHIIPPIYQELEDQDQDQELQDQDLETKSQEGSNCSSEGVKVKKKKQEDDYCKTPTRAEQILPAFPRICPPAPRKPKVVPSRSFKVRNSYKSRRMIILNVSREIDCLFNSTSLCNKIKKAKYI